MGGGRTQSNTLRPVWGIQASHDDDGTHAMMTYDDAGWLPARCCAGLHPPPPPSLKKGPEHVHICGNRAKSCTPRPRRGIPHPRGGTHNDDGAHAPGGGAGEARVDGEDIEVGVVHRGRPRWAEGRKGNGGFDTCRVWMGGLLSWKALATSQSGDAPFLK